MSLLRVLKAPKRFYSIPKDSETPIRKPGEALDQFGVDLTKLAQEGRLDPVIGTKKSYK